MPSKPAKNGVANGKSDGHDVRSVLRLFFGGLLLTFFLAQVEMDDGEADDVPEDIPPPEPISNIVLSSQPALGSDLGEWFVERAKYIPLRLTLGERKYLRLLDAALQVSEYTDKIDTLGFGLSKAKRIVHQIRELCAILSGLVLAADYKQGQELFTDRDFAPNSDFYQKVFELTKS
jgi:hypothetical protein